MRRFAEDREGLPLDPFRQWFLDYNQTRKPTLEAGLPRAVRRLGAPTAKATGTA
jgi:hypothetical protein